MKKYFLATATFALPLMVAATGLAQSPTSQTSVPPSVVAPGVAVAPAPKAGALPAIHAADLSAADKEFVQKAAQGGLAEVQLAQLAQQTTSNMEVKQFAQHMIDDHTPNNEQLVKLAEAKGLTPPTEPNAMQQKMLAKLQDTHGAKFDRAYISGQVKAHEAMLKLMKTEAASGTDPDLKTFAQQTQVAVEHHLSMARSLNKAGV